GPLIKSLDQRSCSKKHASSRENVGMVQNAHDNLITGQVGKTWLACAFGRQAARVDHSVLTSNRLFHRWDSSGSAMIAAFPGREKREELLLSWSSRRTAGDSTTSPLLAKNS